MTPEDLLGLWDRVAVGDARMRSRAFAAWGSGCDRAEVAMRPLGEEQLGLLAAWRQLVGGPLDAVVDCPVCTEVLELELEPESMQPPARSEPRAVRDDSGEAVVPRLLTTADLDAVAGLEPAAARVELARRALGVERPSSRLQRDLAHALEDADPAACWWVELSCPACGHGWEEPLQLAAFLWHAVDDAARRLLAEVADLAAAFGWTEAEVLALPPGRRSAYLALAVP